MTGSQYNGYVTVWSAMLFIVCVNHDLCVVKFPAMPTGCAVILDMSKASGYTYLSAQVTYDKIIILYYQNSQITEKRGQITKAPIFGS